MKSSFSPVMHLTSDIKYAALYARVSTEDQGKGFSIPTQIDACQRLAIEALNVRVTWTPEAPLAIEGTIPFDEIVPLPLGRDNHNFTFHLMA
jgi:hypothetical protein